MTQVPDLEALRLLAVSAAERGGELLSRSRTVDPHLEVRLKRWSGSNGLTTDLATSLDVAIDHRVRQVVFSRRPFDSLLSEELPVVTGTSEWRWVIDPLDGTTNQVQGIPHTCVSVSCESRTPSGDWSAAAAAVHDPLRVETFSASRGGGAQLTTLDGREHLRRRATRPGEAVVATELSYDVAHRAEQLAQLALVVPHVRDVRMTGSSALDLCWVAAGRLDGFWEDELGRWDWSAAALVVSEAGGRVTPFGTGVVAGAGAVHEFLLDRLVRGASAEDSVRRPTAPQ